MKILSLFVLMLTALNIPPSFGIDSGNSGIPDSLNIIEKVYLHTDRSTFYPSEDIWFKAYLIDAYDKLLTDHSKNLHVELISPSAEVIQSRIVRIEAGMAHGDFRLPAGLKSGSYILRAYTNYMRNFGEELFYNKSISIINPADTLKNDQNSLPVDNRFEIAFFPEGGSLVENVPSLVAFKAVDANGNACDVSGEVISSSGVTLTTFKSSHKGMGSFYLTPVSGEIYFASVVNRARDSIAIRLPTSLNNGVVMNISKNNSQELLVTIRTNKKTLPAIINKTLTLEASARSVLYKKASFKMSAQANSFIFPFEDLPDGIYTMTLREENSSPLAERLVFIQKSDDLRIKIITDRKSYEQRDSLSLNLSLSDTNKIEKAFLSLSATDNLFTENNDRFPGTITSWFLLQSDIRGTVEEPAYYFDPSNAERLKDLDNLLLTQGWRDFTWKHYKSVFLPEDGFILSGRVRKVLTDKPLKDAIVNIGIFKTGNPVIRVLASDTTGKFLLDGLNFSGKAKVIVSTIDRKDRLNGWVQVDSMIYQPAKILPPRAMTKTIAARTVQDSIKPEQKYSKYIQYAEIKRSTSRKYRLSDTIRPGEVTIIARKVDAPESARARSRRYLMSTPDREIVITEMEEKYNNTFQFIDFRLLAPIATKMPSGAGHRLVNPLYLIDGVYATEDEVKMLPVDWVERIDVATNEAALAPFKLVSIGMSSPTLKGESVDMAQLGLSGSRRSGGAIDGVISIITRNINNTKAIPVFYTANVQISGYDEPRVFYSPKHHASLQSDYKPDQRITLFWKPDITIEHNKNMVLNYYNADSPGHIKITVEGITSSGIPVTGTAEYEVK